MRADHHTIRRTQTRPNAPSRPYAGVRVFDLTSGFSGSGTEHLHLVPLSSLAASCAATQDDIHNLPKSFAKDRDILEWCAALIAHAPSAAPLLSEAATHGWRVAVSGLNGGGYHLDVPARLIIIDNQGMAAEGLSRTPYFRNGFLVTFIRALRDVWHENRMPRYETQYQPDHVLMLERVRAADTHIAVIQAIWELRGAGFTDIWRYLLGSEEGDMAIMFSRYLERDPAGFMDGTALAHAFRQWYADHERVNTCDHQTLETLDQIMSAALSRDAFGHRDFTPRHIECMSVMPDGICYLAGFGRSIMSDPFFAGLHDVYNQAHYFQIIHDAQAVTVNNVPFRDAKLARKIFPEGETISQE